jgi:polyhydroxyalkanoate synthase
MVSWKSADASMADVVWDHYIASQMEAIEVVCERLKVPSVHTIGYCVAGTTLAATLAILARRGDAAKVASATFFTAQVDFEKAGDLKNFIDDQQIATLQKLAPDGYLDGRYLAATFNLLRSNDLIWNYVINNYLMGEDYRAFDLLFWNGTRPTCPPNGIMSICATSIATTGWRCPIRLRHWARRSTWPRSPPLLHSGGPRGSHRAAESVWRMTRHLPNAPHVFVLAGSGHIAGVVNPPAAGNINIGPMTRRATRWPNSPPGRMKRRAAGGRIGAHGWQGSTARRCPPRANACTGRARRFGDRGCTRALCEGALIAHLRICVKSSDKNPGGS